MKPRYDVQFPNTAKLEALASEDKVSKLPEFKLLEDYNVIVDGMQFTVPKGFITDLASIPRWARWYINPSDTDIQPIAILHDYLYVYCGGTLPGSTLNRKLTRNESDELLYAGCRALKMNVFKAHIVYYSVNLFGKSVWDAHIKKAK